MSRTCCNQNAPLTADQGGTNTMATVAPSNVYYTIDELNPSANFLESALHYAELGLPVFPLYPQSKAPATPNGFYNATIDLNQIRRWWSENPNYNIATPTGHASAVIVIDGDGNIGMESVAKLEAKLGTLPRTVTQITPGKIKAGQHVGEGQHWIFRPNGQSFFCRTNIDKGVDIKADGGYVVLAPSIHPDGTGTYKFAVGYSFDDIEVAELPPAWNAWILAKQEKKKQCKAPADQAAPQKNKTGFDWFSESGVWCNHLGNLQELGWGFFEHDGVIYFQTPDGSHAPSMHDGNINNGVAYFFSRAPLPFEAEKGYTICQLFAGALFGDISKKGLAQFAERYLQGNESLIEEYLTRYGKVTQSNTPCNTQCNTGETAKILGSNGIFVTSVTFVRKNNNDSDTHRVMILDNGEPIIEKTFRDQSNKSLSLRVVGGKKHYLTLYLQGSVRFEWHSKTSVTSVDSKVTIWLNSFKSDDSYTYRREDNPANPNEWEIDLGFRTITHNTMSTPPFRTNTHEDVIAVTEEDCRWYW